MKKLFNSKNQEKVIDIYDNLQKDRKKIKNRALLMVIFLFGVNAFAWFTYIARADFNFDATVVAWDVSFYNDSVQVNDVIIDVGEIYPGFGDSSIDAANQPYSKVIEVSNTGEVNAKFSYRVKNFTIMGVNAIPSGYTDAEVIEMMKSFYPFIIEMEASSTTLKPNEKLSYKFSLYWPFEEATKYFQLNDLYTYDPSINYYTLVNGTYTLAIVDESTFATMRNTLYVEKDDADSFFGSQCAIYEANTGEECVSVSIELKVEQTI